jgi:hypothetical protein
MSENTNALLESLANPRHDSFLMLHSRVDTSQQPSSVKQQTRLSPNLNEFSLYHQDSPPKSSILSMDLFNSIDFDKLPTNITESNVSTAHANITRTFHRPKAESCMLN